MLRLALHLLLALSARADDVLTREVVSSAFRYRGGPVKVLVLDADQTVRISTTVYRAPRAPAEVVLLPGVQEKIAEYEAKGYFVAILSNQMNAVKDTGLEKIDLTMQETVRQLGPAVHYYDFAEAEIDAKPAPAMFDRLEAALRAKYGAGARIDRRGSLMVGDAAYLKGEVRPDGRMGFDTADFDRMFAKNNGIPFEEPQEFFGWKEHGVDRIQNTADLAEYRNRVSGKPAAACPALFSGLEPVSR